MKNPCWQKSKNLLRAGCLTAGLVTAWGVAPSYVFATPVEGPPVQLPEPSSLALVATGTAALVLYRKMKSRKR